MDDQDPIDVYVGMRFKALRRERGVTQAALAEALNLSFQQVQKYETGANRVAASTLARAAVALDCPLTAFFPDDLVGTGLGKPVGLSRGSPELAAIYDALPVDRRKLVLELARALADPWQPAS